MKKPVIFSDVSEAAHDARRDANQIIFAESGASGGLGLDIFPIYLELAFPDHENFFIRMIVKRRAVLGRSHGHAAGKIPAGEGGAEVLTGDAADIPVNRPMIPFDAGFVIFPPIGNQLSEANDRDRRDCRFRTGRPAA